MYLYLILHSAAIVKMSGDKQQLLAMGFEEARIDCELLGLRTYQR